MAALKAFVILAVVAACLAEEPAQSAERTKKGIHGAGYGLAPYSALPAYGGAYGNYYSGYGSNYPYNLGGVYSAARAYPYNSAAIGAYPYQSAGYSAYPYHSAAIGAYPYHSAAIGAYPYHSAAFGAYPYASSGYGYPYASRVY